MPGERPITRRWTRSTAFALTAAALSAVLLLLASTGPLSADTPWPTPPPGPEAPVPRIISSGIQPVTLPGATSWVVLPQAMNIPRFPPVPSTQFQSPDGVRITSDAGSIVSTIQLVYQPIAIGDAPSPRGRLELRKAFDLNGYDIQGSRTELDLRRPWVVEIPVRGLTKTFEDPSRLLIARYEGDAGWVPLVTTHHLQREVLEARVLEAGRYGVLAETGIIS